MSRGSLNTVLSFIKSYGIGWILFGNPVEPIRHSPATEAKLYPSPISHFWLQIHSRLLRRHGFIPRHMQRISRPPQLQPQAQNLRPTFQLPRVPPNNGPLCRRIDAFDPAIGHAGYILSSSAMARGKIPYASVRDRPRPCKRGRFKATGIHRYWESV